MTNEAGGKSALSAGLGQLPPQSEVQYLTMTICGTNDDPAECGHWSSPAHVRWRIDKAVAADRERICQALPGGHSVDPQWVADMVRAGPNEKLTGPRFCGSGSAMGWGAFAPDQSKGRP